MKTIVIICLKGGTGKTTTCGALAMAAGANGKRVLCVDMDSQADLSIWLNADLSRPGAYQFLNGESDVIQATESGLDLICGHSDLMAVKTYPGSIKRLKTRITALQGYDYIFIDVGPGLGELQNNALTAADGAIIPLLADAYSLQAFYQAADIIGHIQQTASGLNSLGIILNMYDGRSNVARYMRDTITAAADSRGYAFLGAVHKGAAITEAQAMQVNLYQYKPNSRPAADFKCIFDLL